MTSKERMLRALAGKPADVMPVGAHAWGLYKFQLAGLIGGYEDEGKAWAMGGSALAAVEEKYYETFKPDFFHLSEGRCVYPKDKMRAPEYRELMAEARRLESKKAIDTFAEECYPDASEYMKEGLRFGHVRLLSEKYGDDVFIALHNATPVNDFFDEQGFMGGFQDAMIAALEKTEMVEYFLYRTFERHLGYSRALKAFGAHAHINSESYVSADLVSPKLYERILFGPQKLYYKGIRDAGLSPIMCFWGNIGPLVDWFRELDIDGLMVEESRKGYILDIARIKARMDGRAAVFGNLPGETTLLRGTPDGVAAGTREMIDGLGSKEGFVMCCGSPLAFGTPRENIEAMFGAAREYRGGE